ncbi:hypothetical protein [Microbulbifer taiwanensis]|uniref:hypothetical protein n=1 Tax=Microbulbifer taiwanensis TaxID=986746 RepID=UPI0036177E0F
MNCILKRALTAATLCVAVTLGACTSGGYYSAAPVFSRPYTYPSSRTHYSTRAETRSSYSGSYVAPSGTVIYLPYASSDYYRVRPDYYPREIYSTQSYYYRPYQYYRYRPYYKKDTAIAVTATTAEAGLTAYTAGTSNIAAMPQVAIAGFAAPTGLVPLPASAVIAACDRGTEQ